MKKLAGIHGTVKTIILPKDLQYLNLMPENKQGKPADLGQQGEHVELVMKLKREKMFYVTKLCMLHVYSLSL